jgi:hypothetical protein
VWQDVNSGSTVLLSSGGLRVAVFVGAKGPFVADSVENSKSREVQISAEVHSFQKCDSIPSCKPT